MAQTMITIIPNKEFLELCEGISEANSSKRSFDWNVMLKKSSNIKNLNDYMYTTNVEFIGSGTGRIAYFLPQEKYDGLNKLETPACFKVAHNVKGIAQNKAEAKILKKYNGKKWPCFPYLYDYDKTNSLFILCEVGTPAQESTVEHNYFNVWSKFAKQYKLSNGILINNILRQSEKELNNLIFPNTYSLSEFIKEFSNYIDILYNLKEGHEKHKKAFDNVMLFFKSLEEEHPKYNGITSAIRFCIDHPSNIDPGDFITSRNWAFVKRGSDYVAIPIDWGIDDDVRDKYYSN